MTLASPNLTDRPKLTRQLTRGALHVARAMSTPLLPSDFIDQLNPLANPTVLRGRIEAVHRETANAATLVLRTGRGWLGHRPGQYVRLGVDVDGVRLWRAYSITSSPADRNRITITVRAHGRVSDYLVQAPTGTIVQLDQATGDFTLPDPLPARTLFVTAGSGITPVMGMLRSHDLADTVLVHSAPTPADVIFGEELRSRAAAGRLELHEHHTRTGGLLRPSQLAELVPDLAQRQIWACGPVAMLDDLAEYLTAQGLADRLHTERFRTKLAATGEGGQVSFNTSGIGATADGARPLLDVGEEAGVLLPSGCRMGICYGCVVPLESGSVRDLRTGELTTASPGDGIKIQTCVSAAAGCVELGA